MDDTPQTSSLVDAYIAGFPAEVQQKLNQMRAAVRAAAPDAVEKFSYRMPSYSLAGNLVHFAAFRNHVGFYPGGAGIEAFQQELRGYRTGKGSVQFPLDQPLPIELVSRIVQYRAAQNREKAARKHKRKRSKLN
jgi:uncharacterized protein YdhG (YjbR/CyaY superfamily)